MRKIKYRVEPAKYDIYEKLIKKHNVNWSEIEEVFNSEIQPRIRKMGKDKYNQMRYAAIGKTFSGRYLIIFFVYDEKQKIIKVISARTATKSEKKTYL